MNTGETCSVASVALPHADAASDEAQATPAAQRADPEGEDTYGNWIDQDRSDAATGREAGTDQQAKRSLPGPAGGDRHQGNQEERRFRNPRHWPPCKGRAQS